MAANVTVELTGDETRLLKAMQRVVNQQQKMDAGFEQTGKKGKGMGQQVAAGVQDIASSLIGIGSAAGVVTAAIKLISDEWRHTIELQKESLKLQVDVNVARQDLIRNLGGKSAADVDKALADSSAIARETNVEEKFIASAMADAVSASGGDLEAATNAVRQAAKFLNDRPDAIGGFAGSLLDLQKATQSQDAKVNQGFLQMLGSLSRVVAPQQQAQNIPRSVIGQTAFGATPQEAGALFSALTVGSADFTGATTSTAAISLAEQLRKFFATEGLTAEFEARTGRSRTMGERIAALQESPDLAAKFLKSASFEKVALGPIEQLLTNRDSDVARLYRENLAAIPDNAGLRVFAEEALANRSRDQTEGIARQARAITAAEQQLRMDPRDAMNANAYDAATRMLWQNEPVLDATARRLTLGARAALGGDVSGLSLAELERQRARFASPTVGMGTRLGGPANVYEGQEGFDPTSPLNFRNRDFDPARAAVIDELIAELKAQGQQITEMTEALRENTKETKANTDRTGNANGRPPVNRYGQGE